MQPSPLVCSLVAEAACACAVLQPHDALRKKIQPELDNIEAAVASGRMGLLAQPSKSRWKGDVTRAPPHLKPARKAALDAWNALAKLLWRGATSTWPGREVFWISGKCQCRIFRLGPQMFGKFFDISPFFASARPAAPV